MGILGPTAPVGTVVCVNYLLLVRVPRKFRTLKKLCLEGVSLI